MNRDTSSDTTATRIRAARKAQMEIMGIAFIVLLVSVGFLFVLSFSTRQQPAAQSPFVTYSNDQLATNFLAASLKTNVCRQFTLEDLIVSCGMQTGQNCKDGISDPLQACAEVQTKFKLMANQSLAEWKKDYTLKVSYPGNNPPALDFKTAYCSTPRANYKPASFFVPVYQTGQAISVEVSICK